MLIPDIPSTDVFIPKIMAVKCNKHAKKENEPCYIIDLHLRGVCDSRARAAGFNHPVSEKSKSNHGGFNARHKGR